MLFKKKEDNIDYHLGFKIVGSTFKNDDGSKRQDILKSLKNGDTIGLKTYDFQGRTAIGVYTCDGKQIGNIKEEDIPYALDKMKRMRRTHIDNIDKFNDGFGKTIYYAYVVIHFHK